jgi:hypothetical protein
MIKLLCGALAALVLTVPAVAAEGGGEGDAYRVSGPTTHDNLAIYLVHGTSAPGPVPLTLQEALAKGVAKVYETGDVNELAIENLGHEEVFVQAGDMVKGGQQDCVLMVSLSLPAHSGRLPIGSFCVEHGRWTQRGSETAKSFASADAVMPSKAGKLAIAKASPSNEKPAPTPAGTVPKSAGPGLSVGAAQDEVWNDAARTQQALAKNLGKPVAAPQSPSSLKLSLESKALADAQAPHVAALKPAGEIEDDVVGFAFAVNGKLVSADLYPSNGLFRKMWPRLLTASATAALAERDAPRAETPTPAAVLAFLDRGAAPPPPPTALNKYVRQSKREAADKIEIETSRAADGKAFYRSIIAQ